MKKSEIKIAKVKSVRAMKVGGQYRVIVATPWSSALFVKYVDNRAKGDYFLAELILSPCTPHLLDEVSFLARLLRTAKYPKLAKMLKAAFAS